MGSIALALGLALCQETPADATADPLRLVPFHQVRMEDPIWRPRIRTLVHDTLPHAFRNTEVAQERLRLCAEFLENGGGPRPEPHRFNTSDLYKVMEGAALMIQSEPNEEIEAMMDRIIAVIARAQGKDGYLYVPHLTGSIREGEMGPRPYSYLIHSHELYNVGHLYEAAVAYAQATGKTALLAVAEKNAAHVQRAIFEGDPAYNDGEPVMQAPGHQEIEIGLVKLHLYTGKALYLEMARRFLDIRGVTFVPDGEGVNSPTYAQQHAPVAQQHEARGHAVRATYQCAAMAEVDSLTGRHDYDEALHHIWHDLVDTKMHLTGGLGAVHGIEGFGPAYELPNEHSYLETCAAVGNVFFNMRMFLKHRDARYVDVAEIALLNNCLSGIGLDGTSFFYPNPLEARNEHRPRSGWFGTACCPSNIARLIPQVSGSLYATTADALYCALYGRSEARLQVGEQALRITQDSDYPWDGTITLEFAMEQAAEFRLHLRIPTWTGRQLVPGELYEYTAQGGGWSLQLNDRPVQLEVEKGFAVLSRRWEDGDRITLELPMPVMASSCAEAVEANRDRVAFSRGPVVLCAEGVDNGGAVQRLIADPADVGDAHCGIATSGPLAGLPRVRLPARELRLDGSTAETEMTLIPYFAWSNRDRSSMITWLARSPATASPDLWDPANLRYHAVRASHTFANDSVEALRLRHQPRSSSDTSIPRWTSWPRRGEAHWVEIDLGEERELRSVAPYFYDDSGGVQVPASWRLEVPTSAGWTEVELYNTDSYECRPDSYNLVHPARSLRTQRLRLVMTPQHEGTCVGLLAVDVSTQ